MVVPNIYSTDIGQKLNIAHDKINNICYLT